MNRELKDKQKDKIFGHPPEETTQKQKLFAINMIRADYVVPDEDIDHIESPTAMISPDDRNSSWGEGDVSELEMQYNQADIFPKVSESVHSESEMSEKLRKLIESANSITDMDW